MRCPIDVPHPPHPWAPPVVDPDNPRILHVLTTLDCPGRTSFLEEEEAEPGET